MRTRRGDLPAIDGGEPVRREFLPFFRPSIDEQDIEGVTAALNSGWLTLGPQTRRFEEELRRYLGARHVVAVNSCSAAMFLALKAMGVGPGHEVITSALTFASTVAGIIHTGARPVLADIEEGTFGPAPQEFTRRTTERTRVYLPVHFGGQACLIEEICGTAKTRGIRVLEDAAHSFGATCGGRKIGTFGDATAFSFYATKNLTCGEGGCLATDDDEIARRFELLSYHGMSHGSWDRYSQRGSWYYEVEEAGYKCNMSDLLSSLGLSQLRKVDALSERRRLAAEKLTEGLDGSPYFEVPRVRSGNNHTWHLFVVRLNLDALSIDRDRFTRALTAENIGCSVHFIPVYKHPFFKRYLDADSEYPVCEAYFSRCISLPMFPDMSETDIADIITAMNRIAAHYSRS